MVAQLRSVVGAGALRGDGCGVCGGVLQELCLLPAVQEAPRRLVFSTISDTFSNSKLKLKLFIAVHERYRLIRLHII